MESKMNVTELLGKRVLLKIGGAMFGRQDCTEFKVLEIAPSGNWVKLQSMHGNKFWKPLPEISFIEELRELNPGKPDAA